MTEAISIIWDIKDVKAVAKDKFGKSISSEAAITVLEYLEEQHDSCVGINWDILSRAIEQLVSGGKITLVPITT